MMMLKILKTILILTITINCNTGISGQELRGLSGNPVLFNVIDKKDINTFRVKELIKIDLPFFEDFSDYGPVPLKLPYPKSVRWSDKSAFINSQYADSMISIGVATLDAYDQFGVPYSLEISKKGSDTLTSNPFNINSADDSIYLSFFYQAGGKGDKPETGDSLFVDFFTPQSQWVNVWQIPGGSYQHIFTQQILLVPDSLQMDNLQFRFRNLTSIENINDNKQSNADQWHLDYIQLVRTLNPDTLANLNDAMVIEPLLPTLTDYSSVPYHHLDMARASSERTHTTMVIRTFFPENPDPMSLTRIHSSYDVENKKYKVSENIANPIEPLDIQSFKDIFIADMSYNQGSKSGKLELLSYLTINNTAQRTINDTLRRTEFYSDYYAYDDGSAEFGFGISGEDQDMIYMANRYRIYRKASDPDTLKAIYIYFNKTVGHSTGDILFKICVWDNNGNKPGDILYESSQYNTVDTMQAYLNDFKRYDLETPILVSDTIYVGIIQEAAEFINIGYDINNNNLNNIYIKTSLADWYIPSSVKPGSLMIRPSFGTEDISTGLTKNNLNSEVNIFPNPANEYINIILPDELSNKPLNIQVVNIMGITQLLGITDNSSIDISSLQSGIYFIILTSKDGNFKTTVKFLKNQ